LFDARLTGTSFLRRLSHADADADADADPSRAAPAMTTSMSGVTSRVKALERKAGTRGPCRRRNTPDTNR
jgi:hypothetical protein